MSVYWHYLNWLTSLFFNHKQLKNSPKRTDKFSRGTECEILTAMRISM